MTPSLVGGRCVVAASRVRRLTPQTGSLALRRSSFSSDLVHAGHESRIHRLAFTDIVLRLLLVVADHSVQAAGNLVEGRS